MQQASETPTAAKDGKLPKTRLQTFIHDLSEYVTNGTMRGMNRIITISCTVLPVESALPSRVWFSGRGEGGGLSPSTGEDLFSVDSAAVSLQLCVAQKKVEREKQGRGAAR